MNAVIVIDMLNDFIKKDGPLYIGLRAKQVTKNIKKILESEKAKGSAIFLLGDQHQPDDPEFKLFPYHCVKGTCGCMSIDELKDYGPVIPKTTYSAFTGTELAQQLADLKPEKVTIVGVCTDICILYAVADCVSLGYNVEVPADCVASYNEDAHNFALTHIEKILGAKVTNKKKGYVFDEATLKGKNADIYFLRTKEILEKENVNNTVTMEFFPSADGILCGINQAIDLLKDVLPEGSEIWAMEEGAPIARKETVMRVKASYNSFGIYETALLGMLASQTGWATAARECVEAAGNVPCISFGARHVHPSVSPFMEYAAIVGGCTTCATTAGAKLAGKKPSGTMPHALVLNMGDTVDAALAFDKYIDTSILRSVLVDTFKDEAEEALNVASALGQKLTSVRLDTARERGGVTADLIKEVRARLDLAGYTNVGIFVTGGLTPERILDYKAKGAPVTGFGIGSFISGRSAVDFTADIYEINGRPVAKRGRIPGIKPNAKLKQVI